jgi:hypothetical protein
MPPAGKPYSAGAAPFTMAATLDVTRQWRLHVAEGTEALRVGLPGLVNVREAYSLRGLACVRSRVGECKQSSAVGLCDDLVLRLRFQMLRLDFFFSCALEMGTCGEATPLHQCSV